MRTQKPLERLSVVSHVSVQYEQLQDDIMNGLRDPCDGAKLTQSNQVDLNLDYGFTWNNDNPVEHGKYQTGRILSAYRSKSALGPFR